MRSEFHFPGCHDDSRRSTDPALRIWRARFLGQEQLRFGASGFAARRNTPVNGRGITMLVGGCGMPHLLKPLQPWPIFLYSRSRARFLDCPCHYCHILRFSAVVTPSTMVCYHLKLEQWMFGGNSNQRFASRNPAHANSTILPPKQANQDTCHPHQTSQYPCLSCHFDIDHLQLAFLGTQLELSTPLPETFASAKAFLLNCSRYFASCVEMH